MEIAIASTSDIQSVWRAWDGFVVTVERRYDPAHVEGLVLREADGRIAGLVTWRVEGCLAEVVTLDAFPPARGSGARLLEAAEEELALRGVGGIRLIVTNDNVRALAFYQRQGYRLVRVHLDFMERVRRAKPNLPRVAENGLARLDGWELEKPVFGPLELRADSAADAEGIRALLVTAFPTPAEADLVEALLGGPDSIASLVAVRRGEVLGHVLFTRGWLGAVPVACLAPLAVSSHVRRRGIGASLVRAGLDRCRKAGESLAAVLGDPAYYGRFGFQVNGAIGSEYEPVPRHFQVLPLVEEALDGLSGTVRYADAFGRFEV